MLSIRNIKFSFTRGIAFWLAMLAGLLYSSWPLGYILNPATAHSALASEFEAAHQPYNWLFVLLDVACGVTMLALGLLQWRRATKTLLRVSIAAYATFAALVVVAALAPYNCNSLDTRCMLAPHSPLLLIHGLASTVSIVALFACLLSIAMTLRGQLRSLAGVIVWFLGLSWVACGIALFLLWHTSTEVIIQYAFISICSLSIVASIWLVEHISTHQREPETNLSKEICQLPIILPRLGQYDEQ
jgi:hypothetical protein